MIRFSNVTKQYPSGQTALRSVSFAIESNQLVFLTGHSGAGKSTLIKLITLKEKPTHGHVFVNDRNLSALAGNQIAYYRRSIGVVQQDHKLLFDRTVMDNIALPLIVRNMEMSKIRRRISVVLEMVGLRGKEKAYPINLSGGEQQRVGIARAIVGRPQLIMADEPTGNLDEELGDEIMDIFKLLVQYETTIIVATHDRHHFSGQRFNVFELRNGIITPSNIV